MKSLESHPGHAKKEKQVSKTVWMRVGLFACLIAALGFLALAILGRRETLKYEQLYSQLAGESASVAVALQFTKGGSSACDFLFGRIETEQDPEVVATAINIIGSASCSDIPKLLKYLQHPFYKVRVMAIDALVKSKHPKIKDLLRNVVNTDSDERVLFFAIYKMSENVDSGDKEYFMSLKQAPIYKQTSLRDMIDKVIARFP
jgi:hypothetical protein